GLFENHDIKIAPRSSTSLSIVATELNNQVKVSTVIVIPRIKNCIRANLITLCSVWSIYKAHDEARISFKEVWYEALPN
ncbi:MAG TPA: hypothetical protein VFY68_04755, partial [Nitrososphaeraceae archaeon]|nr:hypothetical protein [Nitrososphaeraceae archaeon]